MSPHSSVSVAGFAPPPALFASRRLALPARRNAAVPSRRVPAMVAERSRLPHTEQVSKQSTFKQPQAPVNPVLPAPSQPRPPTVTNFSIPFEDLVIRPFHPRDADAVADVISAALREHGLPWDPEKADNDAVTVPTSYAAGEFWVVEDPASATIVATAAFRPFPERGPAAVEIRKMYLVPDVRRRGLGSFLLTALEQRAHQLGYLISVVETSSLLPAACALYRARDYTDSRVPIVTKRCDAILEKRLGCIPVASNGLEVVDNTRGWTVAYVPRDVVSKHRLLFRAAVVLVQTGDRILVHRRSLTKKTYPGRMAVVVTGCVDWGETPLEAARREVGEEVGLLDLKFSEAFEPWVAVGSSDGQRIMFHPFVAIGDFAEEDVVCEPSEVDCALMMTRAEIQEEGIGGSLWNEFRKHAL